MPESDVAALEGVWKAYGREEYVLRGVSLSVQQGDFLAVYGRSGSGKSTLLRLLGLLDRPTKGEVKLLGRETSSLGESGAARLRLENVGFVFQSLNLIPHITLLENIQVPMWIRGVDGAKRARRAMELLSHFGLQGLAGRLPSEVSMGEQQRVAALRALANEPRLILADEPTAHLDDENAKALIDFISELNGDYGTTVVMSTTSPADAAGARKRYNLASGRLAQVG